MTAFRNNIYLYHLLSFVLGAVYFYGVIFFFNVIGYYLGSYMPFSESNQDLLAPVLIANFITTIFGSFVPSLFVIAIIHLLLKPKTWFYLVGVSFSYIILSIYYSLSVPVEYINYNYIDYAVKYSSGLIFLYTLTYIYLKSKPNKAFKRDAEKAPRPLT